MPRTYRYAERWPEIAKLIQGMSIRDTRRGEFEKFATKILRAKGRYVEVEHATSVPWPLVGVLHLRESSCDFDTYLGNGQKLDRRTTIEPTGRGPFCASLPAPPEAFVDGATDALKIDGLSGVAQPTDRWDLGRYWGSWPLEKMIFFAERYNGLGYWYRGLPSPYIWGGTTVQQAGKYVSDGVFDAQVWDSQPGCAPILWMLGHLDPSIDYLRES